MDLLDRTKFQGPFGMEQMSDAPNVLQKFGTGPNILQGMFFKFPANFITFEILSKIFPVDM